VRTGDHVEDFELPDQLGRPWRLSAALAGGPVVVFFFPAAMTTGCAKEACRFRDLAGDYVDAGATRVGVSADAVEVLRLFHDTHRLALPLLSDAGGAVAARFGVRRGAVGRRLALPVRRVTFVLAPDGRVVGRFADELHGERHAEEALRILARG